MTTLAELKVLAGGCRVNDKCDGSCDDCTQRVTIAKLGALITKAIVVATYHAQGPHGCDDSLCTPCAIAAILKGSE